jgi:hypothetical protein
MTEKSPHCQQTCLGMTLKPNLTCTMCKINTKWSKALSVKPGNRKLSETNLGRNLHGIGVGNNL